MSDLRYLDRRVGSQMVGSQMVGSQMVGSRGRILVVEQLELLIDYKLPKPFCFSALPIGFPIGF